METRLDRMEDNLDRLENSHTQIQVAMGKIESAQASIMDSLEDLRHQLLGNGQPGRIDKLEQRTTSNEKMIYMVLGAMTLITSLAQIMPAVLAFFKKGQ